MGKKKFLSCYLLFSRLFALSEEIVSSSGRHPKDAAVAENRSSSDVVPSLVTVASGSEGVRCPAVRLAGCGGALGPPFTLRTVCQTLQI